MRIIQNRLKINAKIEQNLNYKINKMDAKKVGLYVLGGVGVVAAYKYLERQSNKRANIKDIIH